MRIRPMHSRGPLRFLGSVIIACAAAMSAAQSPAQVPVRATPATPAGRGERAPDYPVRPPAPPEQVARGQQLFKSNCSFCHGSDARGGETGPNLVRAQRSEEHTSELQSQSNLVCRPLLDKKIKNTC